MKRKLLSMLCLLSVAITSFAAEKAVATLTFGAGKNPNNSSYKGSFKSTIVENGVENQWEVSGFNNNNNSSTWNGAIKCGTTSGAYTATITTLTPLSNAVSKVAVNITEVNPSNLNSITLSVSTDNATWTDAGTFALSTGSQAVTIENPTPDAYYKLSFDCNTCSNNGRAAAINKVEYFTEAGDIVITGLQDEYSVALGGTIDLSKTLYVSPTEATLSYEVTEGDTDGLTFNDKVITANKVGKYSVTLTGTSGESNLSKTFTVKVTKKPGKLSFADQIVYGKLGVGVVFQNVIVKEGDENPIITYTSSDPENLIVDAATGQIWSDELAAGSGNEAGVKAAGEYFVTATMAESANYAETTARYKIVIIDPKAPVTYNGLDVFDFTTENPYGIPTLSSGFVEGSADNIEIDAGDIVSISFVTNSGNGYRSWNSSGKYELRVYKGTDMIFSVPEGFVISQIGLAGSSVSGTFDPEAEGGTHLEYKGIPESSQLATHWHAGENQKCREVKLSITGTNSRNDIDKIYVLYEGADSKLKPADLSFGNTYCGVYYNEPAKLPAVSNPHNLPVKYSIQNLDESLYTIVPSKDGKTIEVTLNVEPASYGDLTAFTLEARTEENGTYRSGYAIMRLNVYEHLNITCTDFFTGDELENVNDSYTISGDEDDMYLVAFDVPEGSKMFYQLRLPNDEVFDFGIGLAISDDGFDQEEGYSEYIGSYFPQAPQYIGLPMAGNIPAKVEFYISSYGYKSPKRTIYFTSHIPLVVAFGGNETTLDGTFKYEGHSVNDKDKHIFTLEEIATSDYLFGTLPPNFPAAMLVDLSIEPMFTPVSEEDIPDYDKDNDAMKYEDAEAWFDKDTYALMIKAKHAGKYRLTTTLNGFTANPGQKAVAEIEVTPNLDEVYMHGIDLKDAGNGNFTLAIDKENNPNGRVEYIGTGHPVYGEGNGLWYQLHYDNAATFSTDKPQYAATPDDDKWVRATGSFNLVNEAGQVPSDIHLKVTTNGVTKTKSYAITDIETAVASIEGDNNGEPIYIDMNGMVVTEPSNGIYIRVVNGRADKVMIVE